MASIKLKHTSGNGTILNSPAANPSADVTLKLPSTTGSAGQVLSVASANHSSTNAELEFASVAAGGKILNVESTTSKAITSTASNSMTEYAAINTTITPSSSSNKILIMVSVSFGSSALGGQSFQIYDGSSAISAAVNDNVTIQSTFAAQVQNQYDLKQYSFNFLYAPGDTNAHTIKVYMQADSGTTLWINRYGASASRGGVSTMTLMEVAP